MLNNNSQTGFVPELNFKPLNKNINPYSLNIGNLAFYKKINKLMFQDANNKLHPIERLLFLTSEWNAENGEKRLPKPYVIDENEQVIEYGDKLLYGYIGGEIEQIIIIGSVLSLLYPNYLTNNLDTNISDLESLQKKVIARNNKQRYLAIEEDGSGNLIGYLKVKKNDEKQGKANVRLKIEGAESDGVATLECDGKIVLTITRAEGEQQKAITQILIDGTKDAENITIKDVNKNLIQINKDGVNLSIPNGIIINTDKSVNIQANQSVSVEAKENISVKSDKDITVQSKNATIKAAKVKITGGQLEVMGAAQPNGQGAFCGIPNCLFTGAPHVGNIIQGT